MLKSESLSLVPNLTFWFNDLILGRSRSSMECYLSPLQKVVKGLRVILHCIGIKSISSHLRCPGSGRVGVRSRVGTIFFVFPKYKVRTPSKPGDKRRHLGSNKQRRLTLRQAGTTVDGARAYGRTL